MHQNLNERREFPLVDMLLLFSVTCLTSVQSIQGCIHKGPNESRLGIVLLRCTNELSLGKKIQSSGTVTTYIINNDEDYFLSLCSNYIHFPHNGFTAFGSLKLMKTVYILEHERMQISLPINYAFHLFKDCSI